VRSQQPDCRIFTAGRNDIGISVVSFNHSRGHLIPSLLPLLFHLHFFERRARGQSFNAGSGIPPLSQRAFPHPAVPTSPERRKIREQGPSGSAPSRSKEPIGRPFSRVGRRRPARPELVIRKANFLPSIRTMNGAIRELCLARRDKAHDFTSYLVSPVAQPLSSC